VLWLLLCVVSELRAHLRSPRCGGVQEPILFDLSISDNIRFGKLDATDEEIVEVGPYSSASFTLVPFPLLLLRPSSSFAPFPRPCSSVT
jgi:hypothetical protein